MQDLQLNGSHGLQMQLIQAADILTPEKGIFPGENVAGLSQSLHILPLFRNGLNCDQRGPEFSGLDRAGEKCGISQNKADGSLTQAVAEADLPSFQACDWLSFCIKDLGNLTLGISGLTGGGIDSGRNGKRRSSLRICYYG